MHKPLRKLSLLMLALLLASCGSFQRDGNLQPLGERQGMQEVFPEVALSSPFTGEMVNETPDAWFVEFAGPPTVKGGSPSKLRQQRAAFKSAATAEGIQYSERFDFQRLFNGISVRATPAEVNKLSKLPGVEAVYPVVRFEIPEPNFVSKPELAFALDMTGANYAQETLGLSGEGIRVAVMDTGIDVDHPAFTGRIEKQYDFVGDDYTGPNTPKPDPIADDCNGHGTHVAGIVGGKDTTITGVAPEVSFGSYRVFGCDGYTNADIMIAAMERALSDGMDVLNMSIGSAYTWPQYPTAVASNNLVDAGVVVVASIGNSGDTGIYSAGAPGVGEKVIGVASFDNTHVQLSVFEVEGRQIGYSPMTGSVSAPTSGSEEIVFIGRACSGDGISGDPSGKVALIIRGACTFAEKALNAQEAGATAAIIHNQNPGNFSGTLAGVVVDIPVVSISLENGEFIKAQTTPVTMTWLEASGVFENPTGNLISSLPLWLRVRVVEKE